MEAITTNSIISGILTLILLISGIWLMKTREPYKKVVFAIHKISSVLTLVMVPVIWLYCH